MDVLETYPETDNRDPARCGTKTADGKVGADFNLEINYKINQLINNIASLFIT